MYYFTWLFARMVGLIPVSLLTAFAKFLAWFVFDVLRVRRRLILKNIEIAFPELSDADREVMGRASIYHFVTTLLETIYGGPHDLLGGVTFKNREILDHAMAQGRGVYLVCVHLGNFEVLGGAISTHWKRATVPVKHVGHGGFDRYVHQQRMRYNIDPVRRVKKGEGFNAIRNALGEGRPVGFMLDQARHGAPRLPLFGKPAKTNTSIAGIWQRCPAPVVPVYSRRIAFGVHEVVFLPEVVPIVTSDLAADVIAQSIEYNKIVERMVRVCPEQYWWIHNRWK